MNVIIPATGIGKRFKDAGYKDLKPFIPVLQNKVILDYVIECFDVHNDKFYFIVQDSEKAKFNNLVQTRNLNAEILIYSGDKLGPAGSIYGVKEQLKNILYEEVIISYCDFGQKWDYRNFLNFVKKNDAAQAIIPCYTGYHPHLIPEKNVYAVCKTYNNSYEVYRVIEKYHSRDKLKEFHSSGIYYFRNLKIALEAIERQIDNRDMVNGEYYISISNNYLSNVLCYPFVERFYQFGTPDDFEYAKSKLNSQDIYNERAKIDNTVILAAGRGERFLKLNFDQPKPFLPLGDSCVLENIIATLKRVETKIICVGAEDHKLFWGGIDSIVRYVKPNKIGAAYSYRESCSDLLGDVLILPCDLIAKHINDDFLKLQKKSDAIIFVSRPSRYNCDNPNYFTWVSGDNGEVQQIHVKHRTLESNLIMIGSFYFKDSVLLRESINRMFDEDMRVNGEFFIDSVFGMLLENYKVNYVVVDNYFSFGTPDEYLESKYWFKGDGIIG